MKKEGRRGIAEALSLMKRMEAKGLTGFEGKMLKEQMINEAIKKDRVQVTRNQIIKKLNQLSDDLENTGLRPYVSVNYVFPVEIYGTKQSWRDEDVQNILDKYKDSEKRGSWYDMLSNFHNNGVPAGSRSRGPENKNPLTSIITVGRYKFLWLSENKYNAKEAQKLNAIQDLRMSLGVPLYGSDPTNTRRKTDAGVSFNAKDNPVISQDRHPNRTKKDFVSYLIDKEGKIVEEIPGDVVRAMSTPKAKKDPVEKYVMQALASRPEAAEEYARKRREIEEMLYQGQFKYDQILSIVATAGQEAFYYINDKVIAKAAKTTDINQEEMVRIAKEMLDVSFNEVDNFALEHNTPTM